MIEAYLAAGARSMGISLDHGKAGLLRRYYDRLIEENKKYNLTAITGEKEVADKHFLDSLTCLKVLDFKGKYVMDMGTGAGFPGIPLKICQPDMELMLVDSVKKKVAFLKDIIKELGMEGATVKWDRAEAMGRSADYRERFDIVVSRAVASLNVLAELCFPLVRVGGCFLSMKGPEVNDEIKLAENAVKILGGRLEVIEHTTLPLSGDQRNLLIFKKHRATPEKYPRRPGMPAKRPII